VMAIGLTAVAPAMAQRVRREREIELIHRGKQYVRAIRLFYRKFGRYPVRLEELEQTNNIRFLRKRYKDPMTVGGDWRLIHYGEAQLTLPNAAPLLPGATTPGSSGTAGMGSSSSSFANTFSSGSQPNPGQTGTTTPAQSGGTAGAATESSQSGQPGQPGTPASQLSSPLGGGPQFGGGPVVGVASTSKKQSIKELNSKNHYNDWEFVYDPRLDVMTAQPLAPGTQPQPPVPGGAPGTQLPAPGAPGMAPTTPAPPR
jgi:type II secretory pathway pseudopilin PulG